MLSSVRRLSMYVLSLALFSVSAVSASSVEFDLGAKVFFERCALCHGVSGMGEGILPLKIDKYPNTNLFKNIKNTDRETIRLAVTKGEGPGNTRLSEYMPPMGEELSSKELSAVIDFVIMLRRNPKKSISLVNKLSESAVINRRLGEDLYNTRCTLCHGKSGVGDGRMARVVKNPPPSNLVLSKMPREYLSKIIELGGEVMGRSPQMPPWGDRFTKSEIESISYYVESLRKK